MLSETVLLHMKNELNTGDQPFFICLINGRVNTVLSCYPVQEHIETSLVRHAARKYSVI